MNNIRTFLKTCLFMKFQLQNLFFTLTVVGLLYYIHITFSDILLLSEESFVPFL